MLSGQGHTDCTEELGQAKAKPVDMSSWLKTSFSASQSMKWPFYYLPGLPFKLFIHFTNTNSWYLETQIT
jgi:hypothetical protein